MVSVEVCRSRRVSLLAKTRTDLDICRILGRLIPGCTSGGGQQEVFQALLGPPIAGQHQFVPGRFRPGAPWTRSTLLRPFIRQCGRTAGRLRWRYLAQPRMSGCDRWHPKSTAIRALLPLQLEIPGSHQPVDRSCCNIDLATHQASHRHIGPPNPLSYPTWGHPYPTVGSGLQAQQHHGQTVRRCAPLAPRCHEPSRGGGLVLRCPSRTCHCLAEPQQCRQLPLGQRPERRPTSSSACFPQRQKLKAQRDSPPFLGPFRRAQDGTRPLRIRHQRVPHVRDRASQPATNVTSRHIYDGRHQGSFRQEDHGGQLDERTLPSQPGVVK